jgi:hypothetical protein
VPKISQRSRVVPEGLAKVARQFTAWTSASSVESVPLLGPSADCRTLPRTQSWFLSRRALRTQPGVLTPGRDKKCVPP